MSGDERRELKLVETALAPLVPQETLYCEPFGVPHKRLGDVIIPAFLKIGGLFDLSERWQPQEQDVLLALSPGPAMFIRIFIEDQLRKQMKLKGN